MRPLGVAFLVAVDAYTHARPALFASGLYPHAGIVAGSFRALPVPLSAACPVVARAGRLHTAPLALPPCLGASGILHLASGPNSGQSDPARMSCRLAGPRE